MVDKKALVLSVGGSSPPLIKSINEFKPDLIYFIPSEGTKSTVDKVLDVTLFSGETRIKITPDSESLHKTFEIAFESIKEINKEVYEVFIDFTAGTKPMTAALVLAAIGLGSKFFYVGSKDDIGRDKDGVGVVKDGFEEIKKQEDPYEIFAISELSKAKDFFNNYQFGATLDNLSYAKSKLKDKDLVLETEYYSKIANFYDIWDKFNDDVHFDNDFQGIKKLNYYLNYLLESIESNERLYKKIENDNPIFLKQMRNNKEFLDKKLSHRNKKLSKKIKHYLPDLLNNARRRIEERKFDDAVARLYRSIELVSQIKLNELDVIDSERLKNNKVFHINKEKLKKELSKKFRDNQIEDVYEYHIRKDYNTKANDKTFKLGMRNNYLLLEDFGSEIAEKYLGDKELQKELNNRNNSILAHALEPVNEDTANDLYNSVFKYSKFLYPKIEDDMKLSEFPKFGENHEN